MNSSDLPIILLLSVLSALTGVIDEPLSILSGTLATAMTAAIAGLIL